VPSHWHRLRDVQEAAPAIGLQIQILNATTIGEIDTAFATFSREEAAKYRELAEKAEDPQIKQEFLELAEICEEVANNIDDRRASG